MPFDELMLLEDRRRAPPVWRSRSAGPRTPNSRDTIRPLVGDTR
jgi:hypothetical protein